MRNKVTQSFLVGNTQVSLLLSLPKTNGLKVYATNSGDPTIYFTNNEKEVLFSIEVSSQQNFGCFDLKEES